MSERSDFMYRLRHGERMSDLCAEYGISRKTGYKYKARFEEEGTTGLYERSRRPVRSPRQTSSSVVEAVLDLRRKYPTWGPKKLKARLERLEPEVRWPAASTIGVLLKDAGLVDGQRRRRRASPTPAGQRVQPTEPNETWCIDFKGQFRLGNGTYCYPLTVTDRVSRYLLHCEALPNTKGEPVIHEFEALFRERGLPERIRSDNGVPFATTGLGGLSQLSVWFLRLGIKLERIDPGCPQQNGQHERMHLTLKRETTRPAAQTMLKQQEKFDAFRDVFNDVRPHEALGMKTPSSIYRPSGRPLPKALAHPEYPFHDLRLRVGARGEIYLRSKRYHVCVALAGQYVGLRLLEEDVWLVSFMDLDLAYLNTSDGTTTPITNHQEPAA